jgi:hypothetical protein
MRPGAALVACVLGSLEILACGNVISQPIGLTPPSDGGIGADATPSVLGDGATESFCSGHGPPVLAGENECIGDLSNVFRFAACACKSLDVSGTLSTDSFDSTSDAGPASGAAASIGSNGEIDINSKLSLAGSLWSGGPGTDGGPSITLSGSNGGGTVSGDVRSAGDLEVGGKYLVGGDVWADGTVILDPGGSLAVLGTLFVPTGDTSSNVQANVVNAPVPVVPPCSCATPIDVSAVVAAYAGENNDSAVGLSPVAALSGTKNLPCGLYYVAGIAGDSVALLVSGRVALFVAGDISVTEDLRIELAPGAEIDVFVSGSVSIKGGFEIGDADSPSRTRIYVGGATLALAANASPLAANIYAPNAVLELSSNFEMWGSLFADRLQFSGAFAIHYDTSVLQVAEASGCGSPAGPCQTCNDCAGATPACKGGTCVPCTTTADCCAPLACTSSGRCQLIIR